MKSVMRVCLAFGLICLQATASVNDENCLVQSQRDVVSKRQGALKPDLPSLLASMQHVDLSRLKHFIKQFPMPAGMPAGIPGMDGMGNFSMADMMQYAMEFLKLLKKDEIVDVMFESIKNMSTGLVRTSDVILVGAKKLDAALDNSTEPEQVLDAVKEFLTTLATEVANTAANITVNQRKFWALVPNDSSLKKMAEPILQMVENATKSDITSMIMPLVESTLSSVLNDKSSFCTQFSPLQGNLTLAKTFMEEQGATTVASAKAMMPQVLPMLEGFAPDVAPTIMKLANTTLDVMDKVMLSAQTSVPTAIDALMKAGKDKLHCAVLASDVQQSGAPLPARFGLAGALAAAVAWMTVA